jgi:hypothetical protein
MLERESLYISQVHSKDSLYYKKANSQSGCFENRWKQFCWESLYISHVLWNESMYCKKPNSQSGCIQTHANKFCCLERASISLMFFGMNQCIVKNQIRKVVVSKPMQILLVSVPLCLSSSFKKNECSRCSQLLIPYSFPVFDVWCHQFNEEDTRHNWRWLMCIMAPIVLLQLRVYSLSFCRGHALHACWIIYEKRFWTGWAHKWLKDVVSRESPLFSAGTNRSSLYVVRHCV